MYQCSGTFPYPLGWKARQLRLATIFCYFIRNDRRFVCLVRHTYDLVYISIRKWGGQYGCSRGGSYGKKITTSCESVPCSHVSLPRRSSSVLCVMLQTLNWTHVFVPALVYSNRNTRVPHAHVFSRETSRVLQLLRWFTQYKCLAKSCVEYWAWSICLPVG